MATDEATPPADADAPQKLTGVPLIFMFQPTEFVVVKKDEVGAWEEMMRTSVGIEKFADFQTARTMHGFETTSLCPGAGMDDCDWNEGDFPTSATA